MIWHVGRDWRKLPNRILFVGKPHRGIPAEPRPSGTIDAWSEARDYFSENWSAYWSYTREIGAGVFGSSSEAWDRIALTNLVKCTNTDAGYAGAETSDLTTPVMVESCVSRLGVCSAEIRLLKPSKVVFYTGSFYPEALNGLILEAGSGWTDITGPSHRRKCGAKRIIWWVREIETSWASSMRVLVTSHPERKKKADYVRLVSGWIKAP